MFFESLMPLIIAVIFCIFGLGVASIVKITTQKENDINQNINSFCVRYSILQNEQKSNLNAQFEKLEKCLFWAEK